MIVIESWARKEFQLRVAQMTNLPEFEKAQRKSLFQIGNVIRREYRDAWSRAPYKRPPGRPSHRAAIRRAIRPVVTRLGNAFYKLKVGISHKTNTMVRIVNILNPGFTPFRAKTKVQGFKIREMMMARAKVIAEQRYKNDMFEQLLKQLNGTGSRSYGGRSANRGNRFAGVSHLEKYVAMTRGNKPIGSRYR